MLTTEVLIADYKDEDKAVAAAAGAGGYGGGMGGSY
jgi:hypothetical protein